jgi:hypothetical protein
MNEDRFDELMRDARETYRVPPTPPLDDMWAEIERRSPALDVHSFDAAAARRGPLSAPRIRRWLAIAATLVAGVGIGRYSASFEKSDIVSPRSVSQVAVVPAAHVDSTVINPYEDETSKYLGQTAALLIALPSEVKGGRTSHQFVDRAGELLTTTRLLIDSPASNDPAMRDLLEDLELVLAQVVRLQNTNSRTELDLINRALEQRDVIPRLRTAVATNTAN